MKQLPTGVALALIVALVPHASSANDWTKEAIQSLIQEYRQAALIECIVYHESRHNRFAVGAAGELGLVQLHPHGELRRFYALGYRDPFDPEEAIEYLAIALRDGRGYLWTTYNGCRS